MSGRIAAESNTGYGRLDSLRKAIQANRIAFPAQVPIFACQHRVDIQWRVAELYFVCGWTCDRLGERYQVTGRRIQQLLQRWVNRAKTLGYLQEIPPDNTDQIMAALATVEPAAGRNADFEMPLTPVLPGVGPGETSVRVM